MSTAWLPFHPEPPCNPSTNGVCRRSPANSFRTWLVRFVCVFGIMFLWQRVLIGGTIFEDDFSSGNLNKWTVFGNVTVDSGTMLAQPIGAIAAAGASPAGVNVNDFTLEYDMAILSNSGTTETYFRLADISNLSDGYMFSFRNTPHVQLYKRVGGNWTLLASTPFAYQLGTFYRVKIDAQGPSLQVSVDDTVVANVIDSQWTSGFVRIHAWQDANSGWYNERIRIDNVRISAVPSPSNWTISLGLVCCVCLIRLVRKRGRWGDTRSHEFG